MSRKIWIILGVTAVLTILVGVGGVFGYLQWREKIVQEWRIIGEAAYEEGSWIAAKRSLRRYLTAYPEDLDVLAKYADAAERVTTNRYVTLHDAAVAYAQLADIDPSNRAALERLIELQVIRRNWNDVEYYADFFLEIEPGDPLLAYHRALALDRLDRSELAIGAYTVLIEEGTPYIDAYGNLAQLLSNQNRRPQAIEVLEQAVAEHPENPEAHLQQVRFHRAEGDLEWAREALQRAMALDSGNAKVLAAAMELALASRDWERAAEYGVRALELNPDNTETYAGLVNAFQNLGDVDAALNLLESMDPYQFANTPELYMIRAELYLYKNDINETEVWLDEYRRVYPDHLIPHEYIQARIQLASGNAVQAATKLATLVQSRPDFRQAQFYLIASYLQLGDRQRARDRLEIYIHNNPGDTQAQALYLREFGGTEALRVAISEADALLVDDRATAEELVAGAVSLFNKSGREGNREANKGKVIQLLRKAINMAPDYPGGYMVLAEVLTNLGDIDEAQAVVEQARQADVADTDLLLVRAAIALAREDSAEAQRLFDQQLSLGDMTVDEVVRWATFLIRRDSIDSGMKAFDKALATFEGEDASFLALEQIELATRHGEVDKALELIREMRERGTTGTDTTYVLGEQEERLVQLLLRSGPRQDVEKAASLVKALRAERPEDERVSLMYAQVLLAQDPPDLAGARAITEPLLDANPENLSVIMTAADVAAGDGNYSRALEFARQALNSPAADADTLVYVAQLQNRLNRYRDAIATLERALQIDPEHIRAMTLLVETLRVEGRLQQAEVRLNQLENLVANSPNAAQSIAMMRGRLKLQRGEDLGAVVTTLRDYLNDNPEDVRAVGDLARALAVRGDVDEGEQVMTRFAEQHRGDPEAWVALGQFYMTLPRGADIQKASTALTQALVADPNNLSAMLRLVDIYLNTNRNPQALALMDRYLSLQPDHAEVLFQKARLLAEQGQHEKALPAITHSLDLEPGAASYLLRGTIHIGLGEFEKAIDDLQESNRLDSSSTAQLDLALAEAYAGLGDMDSALIYLERGKRQVNVNNPVDQERVSRIEAMMANTDDSA